MALPYKRIFAFFSAVAVLLAAALIVAGRPAAPPERDAIAVTIFPLYDIVRYIAPEDVEVLLIMPPGTSPHVFEPGPSTMRTLERSKVLFAIGHGLDDWTADLAVASGTPIVSAYSGVKLRSYDGNGHHEEEEEDAERHHEEGEEDAEGHHHEGVDPHYWLSMENAIAMTATISVELASHFPERRDEITAHHNSLLGRLRDTDYRIKKMLEGVENRSLVTLHDAWYYFAEEYGLEIAATFEPSAGKEPTPQYLSAIGRAIEQTGARTLYSEPQLSAQTLESFASDNGLVIAVLDPLGGTAGRESYAEMMLYNARTIAENQ